MKKDIYIIGSGGLAKEIAFLIEEINKINDIWQIKGFVDREEILGTNNGKYNVVISDDELLKVNKETYAIFGIGEPLLVKKLVEKFKVNSKIIFPNIIHPNFIGDISNIKMGEGNIITANNNFTTNIIIGSFNLFNLSCTVGHDSKIGNYNIFNPSVNLSGGLKISDCNLIGTGAQVLQYLEFLTDEIIVGAGAVVTKNIDEKGVYVGIPAKRIK